MEQKFIYNGAAMIKVAASDKDMLTEACKAELDRQKEAEAQSAQVFADVMDALMVKCDRLAYEKVKLQESILHSYEVKEGKAPKTFKDRVIDKLEGIWLGFFFLLIRLGLVEECD